MTMFHIYQIASFDVSKETRGQLPPTTRVTTLEFPSIDQQHTIINNGGECSDEKMFFRLGSLQVMELACNCFCFLVYHFRVIQKYLDLNLDYETFQVIEANYDTMYSLANTFTDSSKWISQSPYAQVFSNGVGKSHLAPASPLHHEPLSLQKDKLLHQFNDSIMLVGAIVFGIPQDKFTDSYDIIMKSVETFALFEGLGGGRKNLRYDCQSSLLAHTLKVLSNLVCELLTAQK